MDDYRNRGSDGTCRIWDVDTGSVLQIFGGRYNYEGFMGFIPSPNPKNLAARMKSIALRSSKQENNICFRPLAYEEARDPPTSSVLKAAREDIIVVPNHIFQMQYARDGKHIAFQAKHYSHLALRGAALTFKYAILLSKGLFGALSST